MCISANAILKHVQPKNQIKNHIKVFLTLPINMCQSNLQKVLKS